jgi:uncharacterized integral membrane protein
MVLVLLLILVVLLFSIIELNITQEMTIDILFTQIGPFPMFYFVIGAIIVGALCVTPTALRYYFAYRRILSYVKKKEKEELKFNEDEVPVDFE